MRLSRTFKVATAAVVLVALAGCGSDRSGSDGAGDDGASKVAVDRFGDLATPCGKGDAEGATDQGVTDAEIAIGFGDDSGFQYAPGINEDMGDAIEAMIDWCNEQGGINGRTIKGIRYDAALTNAAGVMQKACAEVFMLVGQGFANDEAAEPYRVACKLPEVPGFTVGDNATMGPDKFEPLPFALDHYNRGTLVQAAKIRPAFKAGPAVLDSDAAVIRAARSRTIAGLRSLDITPAADCTISIAQAGEPSYLPFAQRLKKCGAESVFITNNPIPSMFGFLEAVDRAGLEPDLVSEAQWYGQTSAQWNGYNHYADGLITGIKIQPFENADISPATQQYLDLLTEHKGKKAMLGVQATSAFLLWATVAKECGSDLTRDCMTKGLSEVHEWTGGGLHAPSDPGGNMPTKCVMMMELDGRDWKQIGPEERGQFECSDENVIELDPKDFGVTLNADRISTTFLK